MAHSGIRDGKSDGSVPIAAFLSAALLFAASPALGRDKLPLADNPLPCPIEAPVRVGSASTLAGFEVLAACTPADVIVAPATSMPMPAFDNVRVQVISPSPTSEARVLPAMERRRGREPKAAPVPGGAVVQLVRLDSGTRVVRLAPAVQLPELPVPTTDFVEGQDPIDRGVAFAMGLRPRSYSSPYDGIIDAAAQRHGLNPLFVHAVIHQESRYRPNAISVAGARGLMQLMPGTAAMMGVRDVNQLWDPGTNVEAGARLLSRLVQRFPGRTDLVLAAYNAGEGAVTRYGYTVPPYAETRGYVARVQQHYQQLLAENRSSGD